MTSVLSRARAVLLTPRPAWQDIREESAADSAQLFRYVCILALLPPAAAVAERYLFNRGVVSSAVHFPLGYVLASNILWYGVIIVNMIITAAVITAITSRGNSGWLSRRGLQLAGYSYTPLFAASAVMIIPGLGWLVYPAILYSLYLLFLGIRTLTGSAPARAAVQAVTASVAAGLLLGVLNGMEYLLESFVAGKVFF